MGAMAAAMLSLGDRIVAELSRGTLEQTMIKGGDGYVLLIHAGHTAVLAVIARKDARLGLVFLDSVRAASEIAAILWPSLPRKPPGFSLGEVQNGNPVLRTADSAVSMACGRMSVAIMDANTISIQWNSDDF